LLSRSAILKRGGIDWVVMVAAAAATESSTNPAGPNLRSLDRRLSGLPDRRLKLELMAPHMALRNKKVKGKRMFSGSIPALVTPIRDGAIDEKAFRALVDWQIESGSSAL